MKKSERLVTFIDNLIENFNIKEKDINVFKVLLYFSEKGNEYVQGEAQNVVDLLKDTKNIFEKNKNIKLTKDEYGKILDNATRIAIKTLNKNIEVPHFVLGAMDLGRQYNKIPVELYNLSYNYLSNRNVVKQVPKKGSVKVQKKASRNQLKNIHPKDFEKKLEEKIILNREFISEISSILSLKYLKMDLKPYLPDGIFLFIGKKSTGKSEFSYSIAEAYYGSRDMVVEMDLHLLDIDDEDSNESEINQAALFLSIAEESTERVFLIKNMESIQKNFYLILSQIFSKGHVHVKGKKIDFSDSIFILTLDKSILSSLTKKIGFNNDNRDENVKEIKKIITKEFGEEFISYFDGIYIFKDLTIEDYELLFNKRIETVKDLAEKNNLKLTISNSIVKYLAKEYYKETKIIPNQLGKFIEQKIMIPLVRAIKGNPKKRTFKISLKNNKIEIN